MNTHEPQTDILIELISSGNTCQKCRHLSANELMHCVVMINDTAHYHLVCTSCNDVKTPDTKHVTQYVEKLQSTKSTQPMSHRTRRERTPQNDTQHTAIAPRAPDLLNRILDDIKAQCDSYDTIIYPHACDSCHATNWIYCSKSGRPDWLVCRQCGKSHKPRNPYRS